MFIRISRKKWSTSFIKLSSCLIENGRSQHSRFFRMGTRAVIQCRVLRHQDRFLNRVHCETAIIHAEARLIERRVLSLVDVRPNRGTKEESYRLIQQKIDLITTDEAAINLSNNAQNDTYTSALYCGWMSKKRFAVPNALSLVGSMIGIAFSMR